MTHLPLPTLLLLGALTAFGALSIDMYLPAFPTLAREFATGPGAIAYTVAAFFVGLAVGQPIYGPLSDRFGRKRPLLVGLVLYCVGSLGCAQAGSLAALLGWRFVQALGGCAGQVLTRAMVRDEHEHQHAARIFSVLMLVMGLAPILAPMAGGWVLEVSTWRAIFWGLAAFGTATALAAALLLRETLPAARRVALPLAEVLRVYGGLLRQPRFVGYVLAGTACQAGMFAYIAGSPFVFITLHQVPASHYGYFFGANAVGLIAMSQLNGWLVGRLPVHTLLAGGVAAAAGASLTLAGATALGLGGFGAIVGLLFTYLAALGFIAPNATALSLGSQRASFGQASALLGTIQFTLATGAGTLVGGLQNGTAVPMAGVIAGCALLGLAGLGLARRAEAQAAGPTAAVA